MSQQGQRFRRRALRRGYKVDEVDEFLERVEATLAGSPLGSPVTSRDVHDFVFRVRFGGYDEWQVDMHLDRVERQLTALEEGGGMPAAEPAQLAGPGSAFALPPGDDSLGAYREPAPRQDPGGYDGGGYDGGGYDGGYDAPPPRRDFDAPPPQRDYDPAPQQHDPYGRDGYGGRDDRPRPVREDEPTMVRPARAAASVPPADPAGAGRAEVPAPAGRAMPRPPAPQPEDFTQKLPPVRSDYEPAGDYPMAAEGRRRESRYEPEPERFEPEPPSFAPEQRYDTHRGYEAPPQPGSGFDPAGYPPPAFDQPRGYEPEPPRFEPPTGEIRHGYEQQPPQPAPTGRFETGFEPGRHGKVDMTTEIPAADSPFTPDDLHRLEQARRTFQVRRFGSGYDPQQVNRLFDAIAATMSGRATVQVSDSELDPGQFSLVQGGLFEAEVDGALRDVRDMFSRRGIAR
ncbi:DivIVA domain-containing protein [Actinocatenispora comari]|uniref:Cell wall synthesis protein Wag31 n=1 Tax=Actinocatenispora comari TaxID=2807577 RepID=A0A8J4AAD5_9ACTN|nr:DivIVA domain-containing protein [Actinocatenispora comari]GIL26150.1 hypothetical protein NUM_14040 [Actinocatenispora comari]